MWTPANFKNWALGGLGSSVGNLGSLGFRGFWDLTFSKLFPVSLPRGQRLPLGEYCEECDGFKDGVVDILPYPNSNTGPWRSVYPQKGQLKKEKRINDENYWRIGREEIIGFQVDRVTLKFRTWQTGVRLDGRETILEVKEHTRGEHIACIYPHWCVSRFWQLFLYPSIHLVYTCRQSESQFDPRIHTHTNTHSTFLPQTIIHLHQNSTLHNRLSSIHWRRISLLARWPP